MDNKQKNRNFKIIMAILALVAVVVVVIVVGDRDAEKMREAEGEILETLQTSYANEGKVEFYPDLKSYEIFLVEDSLTADLLKLGLVLDYNNTTREWDNLVVSYLGLYNSYEFSPLGDKLPDYSLKLKDYYGNSLLEIKDGRVLYDVVRDDMLDK